MTPSGRTNAAQREKVAMAIAKLQNPQHNVICTLLWQHQAVACSIIAYLNDVESFAVESCDIEIRRVIGMVG